MTTLRRGFTLIELLVVIAIIGILSAVVLASLSTTRTKGTDAAIQSDLNTIETQAAIYANDNSATYGVGITSTESNCTAGLFSDPTVSSALGAIQTDNSSPVCILISNGTNATGYIAAAPSITASTTYFCIDSSGNATSTTVAPTTSSTVCGT